MDYPKLKFVVASTPRSGTTYVSTLLQGLGISAGHELIFDPCGLGKRKSHVDTSILEADVSGFVNPYFKHLHNRVPIVHLIRHPVNSINSMIGYKPQTNGYRIGILRRPEWMEVMDLWYYWHQQIAEEAVVTIRLERDYLIDDVVKLGEFLEYNWSRQQVSDATLRAAKGSSTRTDTIVWDMLRPEIQEFAKGYGFK